MPELDEGDVANRARGTDLEGGRTCTDTLLLYGKRTVTVITPTGLLALVSVTAVGQKQNLQSEAYVRRSKVSKLVLSTARSQHADATHLNSIARAEKHVRSMSLLRPE